MEPGDLDWDKELNAYNQFSTRQAVSEAEPDSGTTREVASASRGRKTMAAPTGSSHDRSVSRSGIAPALSHDSTKRDSDHDSEREESASTAAGPVGPPSSPLLNGTGTGTGTSSRNPRRTIAIARQPSKTDLLWDSSEGDEEESEVLGPGNERLMHKLTHFPNDSLGFWKGVYKMEQDAETFNNGVSEQVDHFGDKYTGDRAVFDNYGFFLTHLAPHISHDDPDGPFSQQWEKGFPGALLYQLQARLNALREKFAQTSSLNKDANKDFMKIQQEIDVYKVVKKEFKHDLKRFLKLEAKDDPARLHKKDFKYREKKNTLELKRFDLYARLSLFNAQRKLRALKPLTKVIRAYYDCFKQGLEVLQPYVEELTKLESIVESEQTQMEKVKKILKQTKRKLKEELQDDLVHDQHYHDIVGVRDLGDTVRGSVAESGKETVSEPWMQSREKEGYLYYNFRPVWVTIRDGLFSVQKPGEGVMSLPLMLCTVKRDPSSKTRHVFSVISPHSTISLQADTQWGMHKWMTILQNAISHQINLPRTLPGGEQSNHPVAGTALAQLAAIGGNSQCVDCGAPGPDWLSMNLGVLMCLQCSGFHRSLGVHISKVRSATLDQIDDFLLEYLKAIGNSRSNRIWEAAVDQAGQEGEPGKPDFSKEVGRAEHERWVREKYESRQFVARQPGLSRTDLNHLLFSAIEDNDPLAILKYVVWGADLTWVNADEENRDALLHAVSFSNTVCMELLIQNGAKLNGHDIREWTVLHYCAFQNDVAATQLLLSRGAKALIHNLDAEGRSPLDVANLNLQQVSGEGKSGESLEEQKAAISLVIQALRGAEKDAERPSKFQGALSPSSSSLGLGSVMEGGSSGDRPVLDLLGAGLGGSGGGNSRGSSLGGGGSVPTSPGGPASTQSVPALGVGGMSTNRICEDDLKAAMKELKDKKKNKGIKKLFGVFGKKKDTKQLFIPPPRLARELSLVGAV